MINLALRIGANAVALWVAAKIVGGIDLSSSFWSVVFVAIVFGLINGLIKPIAKLISLPFILLTLGLFALLVNTAMLGLTAAITDSLDIDGFGSAFLGAVIISVVSWILAIVIPDGD